MSFPSLGYLDFHYKPNPRFNILHLETTRKHAKPSLTK